MKQGILSNRLFYCSHLTDTDTDLSQIRNFTVRHSDVADGLRSYIMDYAIADERDSAMRTYLVRDIMTDELACYFSLKSGMASLNERKQSFFDDDRIVFDTIPGIELADFAVNDAYRVAHPARRDIGVLVFKDFILPLARMSAELVAAMVLYIFALPYDDLIKRYHEKYQFLRLDDTDEQALHNRLKPAYDVNCIFMYRRL